MKKREVDQEEEKRKRREDENDEAIVAGGGAHCSEKGTTETQKRSNKAMIALCGRVTMLPMNREMMMLSTKTVSVIQAC